MRGVGVKAGHHHLVCGPLGDSLVCPLPPSGGRKRNLQHAASSTARQRPASTQPTETLPSSLEPITDAVSADGPMAAVETLSVAPMMVRSVRPVTVRDARTGSGVGGCLRALDGAVPARIHPSTCSVDSQKARQTACLLR